MDSVVPFGTSIAVGEPHGSACAEQRDPKVAATSTSVMVTWHEECLPVFVDDAYAQAFGLDGQPLGPAVDIGNRSRRDAHPSIASDGVGYLVLWEYEEPNPPRSVQMRRYDATGQPLTERLIFTPNGTSPVAAFDGTNYLVVWQRPLSTQESRRDLFAARMTPDGTKLDADIPIATLPTIPEDAQSVACGGGVCLIVWRHAGNQLRAVRLGPDGSVLGAPLSIAVDGPIPTTSVTYDGEAFLLAWQEESGELRAAQVTVGGEVVAPGAFSIAAAGLGAVHPVVVSNGAGHRIAMYDRYDASPTTLMRRVRARVIGEPATLPDAGVPDAGVPDAQPPGRRAPGRRPAGRRSRLRPVRARQSAGRGGERDGVLGRRDGAEPGRPGVGQLDHALLPVGRHDRGRRPRADRDVGGAAARRRRERRADGLAVGADRAGGRELLPPGLRQSRRGGAGVRRAQQLPGLRDDGGGDRARPDGRPRWSTRRPSLAVGQSFPAGDSTRNQGSAGAASSAVAYYLSPTPVRGPGAKRLSTTRSTGPLAPAAVSSGQVTVKVPPIASGTYYLVACADVSYDGGGARRAEQLRGVDRDDRDRGDRAMMASEQGRAAPPRRVRSQR